MLDTVIASQLWLPFSLIEIAFRNNADRAVAEAHDAGDDWLLVSGRDGEDLVAAEVEAPPALRRLRGDGSRDDPIAEAARMAGSQLGRERISRDDLIAHLMLGFWVLRCPGALASDRGIDMWALIAQRLSPPLNDAHHLQKVMIHLLRTRNRVAHHEPLLFRAKHVFTKRGDPKDLPSLVTSLESAMLPFLKEVELTVDTAKTIAPMASKYIEAIPNKIRAETASLEATLAAERLRLREAREARLAARDAERTARLRDAGE